MKLLTKWVKMYYFCKRFKNFLIYYKMIYDNVTDRWYLNEFHMMHSKNAMESNRLLQKRLPFSQEEVDTNIERWYAMENKYCQKE